MPDGRAGAFVWAVGIALGLVVGLAYVGAVSLYVAATAPDRLPLPTCTLQASGVRAQTLTDVRVPGTDAAIEMPYQLLVFDAYGCDGVTILLPRQPQGDAP